MMLKITIRILSLVLLIATVFSTFSLFIYSDEISDNDSNNNNTADIVDTKEESVDKPKESFTGENILSYSCYYTPQSKTVNIKGAMNYDAFALYGNSSICIYSIPSGKTESDIIADKNSKPIAESPISITFAFSFKIKSIAERYCRYAVFIRTTDDKYILTSEAQYAETESNFSIIETKDAFKGVAGNYSSNISNLNSQTTIIPVYLDMIFTNDSSGYIYQAYDAFVSFNKTYIDELDTQIRSLSLFDTNVYLQFLLRDGGVMPTNMSSDAEYALPNVFDNQTIISLHALTNFLTSRYSNNTYGNIKGIVLGKAWDNAAKYNSFENIDFEQYTRMCGHYVAIVSNAARDINPQINVMLSFDGNGFFVDNQTSSIDKTSSARFSAKELLSSLMQYFDESTYSGLKCPILIETTETPLDIVSNDIVNGINFNKPMDESKFYIGNHTTVSTYLKELSSKYRSASQYYSILWIPKKELSGNTLCAAYSYAFYKLWADDNVVSFNVEFSQSAKNKDNLKDLIYIIKNIDTEKSFEVTNQMLEFFNKETWSEVISEIKDYAPTQKSHYSSDSLNNLPKNIKGKFVYFDFSEKLLAEDWINGSGCNDIKIDYLRTGEKALKSNFFVGNKDFCDLIYVYEYAENISYTPYIKFNLEISSEQLAPLYEIKFTFKGENSIFESNSIVKGNQEQQIILNMTKAKDFNLLKAVKISVRCLDDSVDNCTLAIKNITGYSKKYNSNKLKDLIEKERDKQKHVNNSDNNINLLYRLGVVALIIIISAVLGYLLISILQKNTHSRKKE